MFDRMQPHATRESPANLFANSFPHADTDYNEMDVDQGKKVINHHSLVQSLCFRSVHFINTVHSNCVTNSQTDYYHSFIHILVTMVCVYLTTLEMYYCTVL